MGDAPSDSCAYSSANRFPPEGSHNLQPHKEFRHAIHASASRFVLLAFAVINCGGSGNPTGNNGGGGGAGLTARINGQTWTASALSIAAQAIPGLPGALLILGSQTSGGTTTSLNITLGCVTGPGTYALGVGPGVYGGIASVGIGSGGGGNADVWLTPLNGVAGSVTITTLSGGKIVGTFQFAGDPDPSNVVGGTKTVTNGSFDLDFTGTLAPVPPNVGSKVSADLDGVPYNAWLVFGLLQDHLGGGRDHVQLHEFGPGDFTGARRRHDHRHLHLQQRVADSDDHRRP